MDPAMTILRREGVEPKLTVCCLYLVAKGWVDIDNRYSVVESRSRLMIVFKLDERV
jgi:hypothetical protein